MVIFPGKYPFTLHAKADHKQKRIHNKFAPCFDQSETAVCHMEQKGEQCDRKGRQKQNTDRQDIIPDQGTLYGCCAAKNAASVQKIIENGGENASRNRTQRIGENAAYARQKPR